MTTARGATRQSKPGTPFVVELEVRTTDRSSAWAELWRRIFATLPDLSENPPQGQGSNEEAA